MTDNITPIFQVVVLGCMGGPKVENLSGYLLSSLSEPEWIALDAGSLLSGIEIAIKNNNLEAQLFSSSSLTPACEMLKNHLKAYLISHAHLDHIAGLVVNSPIDDSKWILGTDPTIDNLRDHIFNGKIWPNYGSEGDRPIKKYHYLRLPIYETIPIPSTKFTVTTFPLSHPRQYPSSAFLIQYKGDSILYFGDTSSDVMEGKKHLASIWEHVGPLVREKKLRGIFLECSHCRAEAVQTIYGHLDSELMIGELRHLAKIAKCSLENFKVIVTHRKESMSCDVDAPSLIANELLERNDIGVHFIFPTRGDKILL